MKAAFSEECRAVAADAPHPARYEDIYDAVKRAVLSPHQPPGSFVSESALARHLGTSRTPVREALARLCGEGFVERPDGRGYVTAPVSPAYITHVARFHAYLEGVAARRAAELVDRHRAIDLRILVTRHESIPNRCCADPSDIEFHLAVAAFADNPLLTRAVADSFAHLQRFIAFIPGSAAFMGRHPNEEHREIVHSIVSRDSSRARFMAERHMLGAFETLIGLVGSAPDAS